MLVGKCREVAVVLAHLMRAAEGCHFVRGHKFLHRLTLVTRRQALHSRITRWWLRNNLRNGEGTTSTPALGIDFIHAKSRWVEPEQFAV
jgi:hypothetical protein